MATTFATMVKHDAVSNEPRIVFLRGGQIISPWHDIPLTTDIQNQIFNMVVEIPRQSNAKLEISKEDCHNAIRQDVHNGKPRELADIPPFHGYPCNYGALPQTWEDPHAIDAETGIPGDDDPLDVCEIGSEVAAVGEVKQVRPLGAIAIIDQGQTDWKIIAIDVRDPLANKLSDIHDVNTYLPGFLDSLKEWYRTYKVPEGKEENTIGLEGRLKNRSFALKLIDRCHASWEASKDSLGI